jgi:outer membrane biosynthesis protein TonB
MLSPSHLYDPNAPITTKEDKELKRTIIIAIVLSIFFIHLPLIYFITMHDFADQNSLAKKMAAPKEEAIMIDLNKVNLPLKIADITKPKVQRKPKKASAQSLYNSSVKKETVSVGKNKKSSQAYQQQKSSQKKQSTEKTKYFSKSQSLKNQLLALQQGEQKKEKQKFAKLYGKSPSKLASLKTSFSAGGSSGDYFPDYKVGNKTYLNTLANPNIGYYVELKRKFRLAFNPSQVLRQNFTQLPKGKILVIWGITVDKLGNLKSVQLIRSSGLRGYDSEAKRTISTSAPFSRPGSTMLSKDGQLHMAWTFVVYL